MHVVCTGWFMKKIYFMRRKLSIYWEDLAYITSEEYEKEKVLFLSYEVSIEVNCEMDMFNLLLFCE